MAGSWSTRTYCVKPASPIYRVTRSILRSPCSPICFYEGWVVLVKYLHTMIRVHDLDATLRFFVDGLGLRETRRMENPQGKYTLVFLAADETPDAEIELTYNWDSSEDYGSARNFGHLAFRVEDIYAT